MTPKPGVSAFERLHELENDRALVLAALEALEQKVDQEAALVHAIAAQARKLDEQLQEAVALLPGRKPGPDLERLGPELLQFVKTLHDELGWGRPRIVEAMRDRGVTEWQVRRALREIAGDVRGSRQGS